MTKYYVESGPNLQVVLEANDHVDAILNAFQLIDDDVMCLADVIIVNERGFVWRRDNHELFGDELVLPTCLVLGSPETTHPSSN